MPFTPHTTEDKKAMLKAIGVASFRELLNTIPESVQFKGKLNLPKPISELEVKRLLTRIASNNRSLTEYISFLGGGAYDHYIPSVINHIISRSEFYTAYTPYQAEVSQGTLQAIYEYQSLICELFAMDVSNASMYDGASALAEACHMARDLTSRNKILIAETIHPYYTKVVRTYTEGLKIPIQLVKSTDGIVDLNELEKLIDDSVAAVLIQHPNFFGVLEPVGELEKIVHKQGALLVACVDPISLGILTPPGEYNADIAVGEGQCLGLPSSLGGPFLGIFTCKKEFIRRMPGRLAARTTDTEGKTGYVLALQTREQHIRRGKATSNICTNEALCALAAAVYLSVMGKQGIKEVAKQCLAKSHYLASAISQIKGFGLAFSKPFFKEFVVKTPVPSAQIIQAALKKRILAGIDLANFDGFKPDWQSNQGGYLLIAVTEKRTRKEMDKLIRLLKTWEQ
uniref:Probable glycine dehydrogenase (decarboxylating) subunit 1 n=1 Tax=candidate division WOR-3 bacterium TaxID=2052148 RepID=A0A7C6A803_UNCW3